jgi:MGT family glycosyltransferase
MATAVVFTYPDPSHVGSVTALISGLVRRGETVYAYSAERYRDSLTGAGARFRPYEIQMGASNTGPFGGMLRRLSFAEEALPALLNELRANPPDYLLSDSAAIWGSIAGHALGIRRVSYRATFALNPAMVNVDKLVQMFYGDAPREFVLGGLLDLARYYEVSQRIDRLYGAHTGDLIAMVEDRQDLNLVLLSRQLQMHAECFDRTYRFVGSSVSLSRKVDFDWSAIGPGPLIYVSLGTVFNNHPEFFRACIDALSDFPYQVVMPVGSRFDQSALGPPPGNIVVCGYAPQSELLKRAALVICHGGPNTVEESLRAGAPMLLYPQAGDQFPLSGWIEQLGAGLRLHPVDITAARLRELATRVLSEPGFRRRAQEIGAAMRNEGGTEQACEAILQFTGSLRTS